MLLIVLVYCQIYWKLLNYNIENRNICRVSRLNVQTNRITVFKILKNSESLDWDKKKTMFSKYIRFYN